MAIIRALPADLRAYPAGCLQFAVAVSNNGRFATATPEVLIPRPVPASDPCLRYAGDGFFVLQKAGRWKVVFVGSDRPACSLGVPRDLTALREALAGRFDRAEADDLLAVGALREDDLAAPRPCSGRPRPRS